MGAAALTMTTTTPNLKDQATGLRQLFSASTLPVHLLTCPSRASLTIPLSQRLSYELADRGHMVAWIDEIDLVEREDWPLPSHLRFDLGQALDGHVDMSAAMHAIKPQLLYGLSCKTRRLGSVERTLQDRLLASGVRFETVIIAAHPAVQPAQYAQMVHHTVISRGVWCSAEVRNAIKQPLDGWKTPQPPIYHNPLSYSAVFLSRH